MNKFIIIFNRPTIYILVVYIVLDTEGQIASILATVLEFIECFWNKFTRILSATNKYQL